METANERSTPLKQGLQKKIIAIVVLVCILAGGSVWYFIYFTKTPTYSMNLIKESIEKHEIVTFKKHVDLDNLLSRGYDDFTSAIIDSDSTMKPEAKAMVSGFIQMLKSPVTLGLKDAISRYVETGKWTEDNTDQQQKNPTDIDPEKIAEKSGLKDSVFRGVAYEKKDGKTATIGITIFDKMANKEAILAIQMRELDDGTWQLTEIANFKEYLMQMEQSKNEILKKYVDDTQPILNKYISTMDELDNKKNTASKEEQLVLIKSLQDKYKECIAELDAISIPEAAKSFSELRKKSLELRAQLLEKQSESLHSNDLKILGEIQGLKVQIATIKNQLSKIEEKTKMPLDSTSTK